MREQEVRELYEAYLQVHQPQEEVEQLDELAPATPRNRQRAVNRRQRQFDRTPMSNSTGGSGEERKALSRLLDTERLSAAASKRRNVDENYDTFDTILEHLVSEGYADTNESALAIMANMSEEWREEILEGLVDALASGAGTVVGTAQRAAREIPKYVQQKVKNVAGTYEYARQSADANAPSGKMTTNPRSREFSHGNQGGKPAPMKPMKTMRNPGPNFGRG